MKHNIDIYIDKMLTKYQWSDKKLAKESGLSTGQISKLKSGKVKKLTAETFYRIINVFNDTIPNASKMIYPAETFTLQAYKVKERNTFGKLMHNIEVSKYSIQEISQKSGISEIRLNELYYRNGSLEAYELILIEKAVNKNSGELFKELFKNL